MHRRVEFLRAGEPTESLRRQPRLLPAQLRPLAEPALIEADTRPVEIVAPHAVPEHVLGDGEVVILQIKPSLWFVPLVSARTLFVIALLLLLALRVSDWTGLTVLSSQILVKVAVGLAMVRVTLAMLEWASRFYVLTDRRVLRFRGIFNVEMFECPLVKIQNTFLTLAIYERILRLGSIHFATAGTGTIEATWQHINRPLEVHEQIQQAIRRAQNHSNGNV